MEEFIRRDTNMTNQNDARILKLQEQVEIKKAKLKKIKGFRPVTNCSLEFEGKRYNLNALVTKVQVVEIMVKLNVLLMSAKELKLEEEYLIGGYKLEEWLSDLQGRLDILSRVEEEKKLKVMEAKLTELLSNDKRIELELNEMEDLLG